MSPLKADSHSAWSGLRTKLRSDRLAVRLFLFLVMMTVGVATTWGQTDYSGLWYIGSVGYNASKPADNYYLCPTEGWCYYKPDNDYSGDGDTYPNPFLTTFKCLNGVYDARKAVWEIEKAPAPNSDYYYIKQKLTGKYLVSNGVIRTTTNGQDRMRVHLESIAPTNLDDKVLFSITPYPVADPEYLVISPKEIIDGSYYTNHDKHNLHKWLTVNNGNTDYLVGRSGKTGGPGTTGDQYQNTTGIVGIYTQDDANAKFYLERPRPIITYNSSNLIEITYPDNTATIYYTTDGTEPPTSGTEHVYSIPFDPSDDVTTIKAVAVVSGEVSNVAEFAPLVLLGSSHKRLIQSQNNEWNMTDFHFYMIPGDETSGILKVNTTSMFRPSMEWYFLNAGNDGLTNKYYYIVNNDNSKSLCYDGTNKVYMDNNTNDNKFKFSIVESATVGTYLIKPYGQTNNLNKNTDNANANAIDLHGSTTSGNTRWKFILPTSLDKTAPFTVSSSSTGSYTYYQLRSSGDEYYIKAPASTDANATMVNAASADENTYWYLEKAVDATNADWLTYYYIRNAKTGDYLYYANDNPSNNNAAFKASTNNGDADRYQFAWAHSTTADYYFIVPKMLLNQTQNNFSTMNRNNATLRVQKVRATGSSAWLFSLVSDFKCAQPVITWSAGDRGYVVTPTESDAKIYYKIGEGELTPTTGTLYTGAISVADLGVESATIRAIAARSSDGSDKSTEASVTVNRVATPGFLLTEDGKVQLTCAMDDVSLYYEMGDPGAVSEPTIASNPYTGLIEGAAGKVIKAIAVKAEWINSAVAESGQIVFSCAQPVIRKASATTFTISCSYPSSGVSIYYTKGDNPVDPTRSSTPYNGEVTFDISELPFTIKAIAVASGYNDSQIATLEITQSLTLDDDGYHIIASNDDFKKFITMAGGIDFDKKYKITVDINASGTDAVTVPFTGELKGVAKTDGTFPVISNLGHPIFNTINGGIVKNIMLDNVTIEQSGNVGAIAGVASGYTRIYNCGILPSTSTSTIKSTTTTGENTGYCGGLVGWLKDDSRVINCFSYANITGGTDVAGIVGHNEAGSTTAVTTVESIDYYSNLRTAVVNCMFYGNITGGSNRYPVYGGVKMVNNTATGINNYDFYRAEASVGTLTDYNCSWPAKEEYLTHYEFYRNLLNSNRELCGWWVGAPSAPSTMSTTDVQGVPKDASLMAKWVLDTEIAPYPILKKFGKYTSPVNIDADASWRTTANEWEGKKLGTLNVTAESGSSLSDKSLTLTITDMDTLRTDYCYRKVQLPYYNTVFGNPDGNSWAAKYGGNYGDNVVIGWKVTVKNGEGTIGELSENWETGYNFADRNCTAKDANRVFAQGGYYYVPNGVENITITAQWASAIYLDNTDRYYDRVSVSTFTPNSSNVYVGTSSVSPFEPAGTRSSTLGNGKTIQNGSISSNIPSGGSVYENAIVLVGNHQYFVGGNDVKGSNKTNGCTIMSADFDIDEEPDNCLIWQLGTDIKRQSFCPIRFDFLPVLEMGLAMKEDGSTQLYSLGCIRPLGHFEVTETSLIHFGQFEFSNKDRSADAYAPIILNGGIFDQYTKGTNNNAYSAANDKINYIILGGNVRMPSFTPGAHVNQNAAFPTRHCAVNILGANIDNIYLTGNYNNEITPNPDNPHCYIDGGRFKHVAAAGKEGIDGDVYFFINHSKIWEFYGGSTLADKRITGSINVSINNSIVDKYCGGPKFGDMYYENDKTIITNATNTIFGVYYGGGNGGTSYVQYEKTDGEQTVSSTFAWGTTGKINNYNAGGYKNATIGYMADYDMEIVNLSTGTNRNRAVYRTYFYAAQFSATNTGSITNNLTDCTVLTNFYGAGNLGGVKGNVTSTLTDTQVYGSAFGAGFSATVPDVTIHNKNKTAPTINVNTGIITPESGGDGTTYTWTNETSLGGQTLSTSNPAVTNVTIDGKTKNYYYTEASLANLGAVSGTVSLTITGSDEKGSVIGTEGDNTTGNVYGGGDASTVSNTSNPASASTIVNINGKTEIFGNVFGGGNEGEVSGSATVNIGETSTSGGTGGNSGGNTGGNSGNGGQ